MKEDPLKEAFTEKVESLSPQGNVSSLCLTSRNFVVEVRTPCPRCKKPTHVKVRGDVTFTRSECDEVEQVEEVNDWNVVERDAQVSDVLICEEEEEDCDAGDCAW